MVVLGLILLLLNLAILIVHLRKNKHMFLLILQLFSTNGMAILFLLSWKENATEILDLSLVMALLAGVTALVFIRRFPGKLKPND